eukprot:jgi/Galph1/764/GphlegSOOS_G5450.1
MGRLTAWEKPVPRYPVIDPNPTAGKVWRSFDLSEYGRIVFLTALGCLIGVTSATRTTRGSSVLMGGISGLWGSTTWSYMSTRNKLKGFKDNGLGRLPLESVQRS